MLKKIVIYTVIFGLGIAAGFTFVLSQDINYLEEQVVREAMILNGLNK